MAVFLTGAGVKPKLAKKASDYAIGESVFLNVNGTPYEFIVVNQGTPSIPPLSTDYSGNYSNADGTWLMMKQVQETTVVANGDDESTLSYPSSPLHSYLNNTFYNLLDADTKAAIKTATLPYFRSDQGGAKVSARVFSLDWGEIGIQSSSGFVTNRLAYFDGATNADRIAYNSANVAKEWVLRSTMISEEEVGDYFAYYEIMTNGGLTYDYSHYANFRPCMIVDSNTLFDSDGFMIKG